MIALVRTLPPVEPGENKRGSAPARDTLDQRWVVALRAPKFHDLGLEFLERGVGPLDVRRIAAVAPGVPGQLESDISPRQLVPPAAGAPSRRRHRPVGAVARSMNQPVRVTGIVVTTSPAAILQFPHHPSYSVIERFRWTPVWMRHGPPTQLSRPINPPATGQCCPFGPEPATGYP